jgi:hypothetical protein
MACALQAYLMQQNTESGIGCVIPDVSACMWRVDYVSFAGYIETASSNLKH